jgi:hypothetical protein
MEQRVDCRKYRVDETCQKRKVGNREQRRRAECVDPEFSAISDDEALWTRTRLQCDIGVS